METIITSIPATKIYIGCLSTLLDNAGIHEYVISEVHKDTVDEFNGISYNNVIALEMPDYLALIFRLKYPDEAIMEEITKQINTLSKRERKKKPKGGWLGIN